MSIIDSLRRQKDAVEAELQAAEAAESRLAEVQRLVAEGEKRLVEIEDKTAQMTAASAVVEQELRRLDAKRQSLDASQVSEEAAIFREVAALGLLLAGDASAEAWTAIKRRGWALGIDSLWRKGVNISPMWHAIRSELLTAASRIGPELWASEKASGAVTNALR